MIVIQSKVLKQKSSFSFPLKTTKEQTQESADWILTKEQTDQVVKWRDEKYGFIAKIAKFASKSKGEFFAFSIKID